jgi:membrane fusion protein, multidrug efflux system
MKKKFMFLFIIILIILAGVMISRNKEEAVTEIAEESAIPVRAAEVERRIIRETVSVSGDIKPWTEVTVYPEVTGRVEKIPVEEGQFVARGDLIAQIDYEKNALTVKQIESQLESARVKLEKLRKDYGRTKRLFEQEVVAEKMLDDAEAAFNTTIHEVESLQSQLELARVRLRDSRITAPVNGIITKKFIEQGEIVGGPVVTIVNIEKVKVVVPVGEKDIIKVKKGQKAEVMFDAYPGKNFSGEVYNVFPEFDSHTRTAQVEIAMDNSARILKPGMFARVDIIITSRENIIIPVESIIEKKDGKHVFEAKDGKAEIRQITTGVEKGSWAEVLSGLEEGSLLIVDGQHLVQNGSQVSVSR